VGEHRRVEIMRRPELGAEIRRRREAFGWSREELAMRVPMSTAGLTDIENAVTQNPQRRTLGGLAKALGCTVEALTGETPPPVTEGKAEVELLEAYRALRILADFQSPADSGGDVTPSPALKALFEASEVPAPEQSTGSVLRRARTAVAGEDTEAFEVIASGISMEPSIQHGDALLVSPQITLAAGRVVVAIHDGVWIVKRLALDKGELVLRSDNVEEDVPLSQVEVRGVVVQLQRNL